MAGEPALNKQGGRCYFVAFDIMACKGQQLIWRSPNGIICVGNRNGNWHKAYIHYASPWCLVSMAEDALEMPVPPKGTDWYNPDKVSAEKFQVDKGYRPILLEEDAEAGDQYLYNDGWKTVNTTITARSKLSTYRTLRPLPDPYAHLKWALAAKKEIWFKEKAVRVYNPAFEQPPECYEIREPKVLPKERIAWEEQDIPVDCWFRDRTSATFPWRLVTTDGSWITMAKGTPSGMDHQTRDITVYTLFKDGWEWSPNRKDWYPCSKEKT